MTLRIESLHEALRQPAALPMSRNTTGVDDRGRQLPLPLGIQDTAIS